MGKDLLFAIRMLKKNPGFTLMAVVALALGIGANTAIFSVVNAVMLSRLPFENPDRLVMVWEQSPRTNKTNVVNPGNFFAWQDRNQSFERVAAWIAFPLSLSGDGEPEVLESMTVSNGFFEILGVKPIMGRWRIPHRAATAGREYPALHGEEPITEVLVVMPGYFAAMNIPIIRGRVFDDRDLASTKPHLVVINQALARQFYPNENPVGKRLTVQWGHPDVPYEIAGVVGDVHQKAMDADPKPGVFIDNMQEPSGPSNLVARTHGDPKMLSQAIQKEIHALDRDIPISGVATMDEYVSSSVASARFNTILLGCFAALALTLASVGIFGVISYSVAQRTQELGIRRALGADSLSVMRLVLVEGLGLAGIGLVIGFAGAFAITRLLESLLFGVTATDPLTFVVVAAILAGVALLASYLPARRAASVDPMVALRYE